MFNIDIFVDSDKEEGMNSTSEMVSNLHNTKKGNPKKIKYNKNYLKKEKERI